MPCRTRRSGCWEASRSASDAAHGSRGQSLTLRAAGEAQKPRLFLEPFLDPTDRILDSAGWIRLLRRADNLFPVSCLWEVMGARTGHGLCTFRRTSCAHEADLPQERRR